MLLCRGVGRKLSVPVVALAVIGWIVYVVGFAVFNLTDNYYTTNNVTNGRAYFADLNGTFPEHRANLLWFPHWCVLITGPFVFFCTAIHLIVGRAFTGVFTKFLTAVYLGAGGAVSYATGVLLFSESRSSLEYVLQLQNQEGWLTDSQYGLWHVLEFAGALGSSFFMALFMMMWPFFSERYEEVEYYDEEDEVKEEDA